MTNANLKTIGNVVKFPARTFDTAWNERPSSMKTRGEGRDKTRKRWDDAAAKVGQAELLAAFRRYIREDKDNLKWGFPGLSVWLNQERYDHWLGGYDTPSSGEPLPTFPDADIRQRLIDLCGEGWVRSYIDQCGLDGTVLIVPRGKATAKARIMERRADLKAAGLTAMREGE